MSGIAESQVCVPCSAFAPLRFADHLARTNRQEHRDQDVREPAAAEGAPPAQPRGRDEFTPRLADVAPLSRPAGSTLVRDVVTIQVQQLLPIGSIIDVTI